jgi:hypothetical protein
MLAVYVLGLIHRVFSMWSSRSADVATLLIAPDLRWS